MQILKKRIAGLRLFLSFQGIGRYLKKFFCKFLPNLATWILFSLSFSSPPSRKCLIVIVYYFVIQAIFLRPLILLGFSFSYLLCQIEVVRSLYANMFDTFYGYNGREKIFFLESFSLWCPLLMIALYHQIKTPISFWCRWGLNPRSLIQPLETLPVELTGTHNGREKIWTWNISLKNIKSYQSMELQSFKHVYHVLNKISFLQSNLSRQNI